MPQRNLSECALWEVPEWEQGQNRRMRVHAPRELDRGLAALHARVHGQHLVVAEQARDVLLIPAQLYIPVTSVAVACPMGAMGFIWTSSSPI